MKSIVWDNGHKITIAKDCGESYDCIDNDFWQMKINLFNISDRQINTSDESLDYRKVAAYLIDNYVNSFDSSVDEILKTYSNYAPSQPSIIARVRDLLDDLLYSDLTKIFIKATFDENFTILPVVYYYTAGDIEIEAISFEELKNGHFNFAGFAWSNLLNKEKLINEIQQYNDYLSGYYHEIQFTTFSDKKGYWEKIDQYYSCLNTKVHEDIFDASDEIFTHVVPNCTKEIYDFVRKNMRIDDDKVMEFFMEELR